jgi:hypothetical protein
MHVPDAGATALPGLTAEEQSTGCSRQYSVFDDIGATIVASSSEDL